jgi:uncharacterized membrane protein YgdD (TMEM256/DUF423 family)
MRALMTFAAILGFLCVALGAFAAHGLSDPQAQGWMRTGATYGLTHVAAALACLALARSGASGARRAVPLFLAGAAIFAGSLAALALGGPRWLGAVTPVGGLLLLAGWAVLAWSARRLDR